MYYIISFYKAVYGEYGVIKGDKRLLALSKTREFTNLMTDIRNRYLSSTIYL